MTGLPHAVLLGDPLQQALAEGGRSGLLVAVAKVDVDRVGEVLDEHEQETADTFVGRAPMMFASPSRPLV